MLPTILKNALDQYVHLFCILHFLLRLWDVYAFIYYGFLNKDDAVKYRETLFAIFSKYDIKQPQKKTLNSLSLSTCVVKI